MKKIQKNLTCPHTVRPAEAIQDMIQMILMLATAESLPDMTQMTMTTDRRAEPEAPEKDTEYRWPRQSEKAAALSPAPHLRLCAV